MNVEQCGIIGRTYDAEDQRHRGYRDRMEIEVEVDSGGVAVGKPLRIDGLSKYGVLKHPLAVNKILESNENRGNIFSRNLPYILGRCCEGVCLRVW